MNKLLINFIKKNQGKQAGVLVALFRQEVTSEYTPHEVRRAIEKLIDNNQLIRKSELKGDKWYKNIYLPVYFLYGIEMSINRMAKSKYNIHNISFDAIRKRLHKGLTPEQALSLPPEQKVPLKYRVTQNESLNEDVYCDMTQQELIEQRQKTRALKPNHPVGAVPENLEEVLDAVCRKFSPDIESQKSESLLEQSKRKSQRYINIPEGEEFDPDDFNL